MTEPYATECLSSSAQFQTACESLGEATPQRQEFAFYEANGVSVTAEALIAGRRKFAITDIVSYKVVDVGPDWSRPVACCLMGSLLLAIPRLQFIGIAILIVGAGLFIALNTRYSVVLVRAAGEVSAYTTTDIGVAKSIVSALERAVAQKRGMMRAG